MTDQQLEKRLRKIGKACFALHFELFSDNSIPDAAVARIIVEKERYAVAATRTRRVYEARRIIHEGRACDALRMIASSTRVAADARSRARELTRTTC